jgi:hypothetical protein
MAKKLEEDLMLKDTICDQICSDLCEVTSERHIRRCLPDEYKMRKRKSVTEQTTDELRTMSVNDDKNVPEQTAMTVDTEGYEQPFDAKRAKMVFAPLRFTVDFSKKKLNISLWEKKLRSLNV